MLMKHFRWNHLYDPTEPSGLAVELEQQVPRAHATAAFRGLVKPYA